VPAHHARDRFLIDAVDHGKLDELPLSAAFYQNRDDVDRFRDQPPAAP
jgi:hypothetical protein